MAASSPLVGGGGTAFLQSFRNPLRLFSRHAYSSPLLYAQTVTPVVPEAPVHVGWQALAPAVTFTILAGLAVIARWYTRACLMRQIRLEDWIVSLSLILSIAMTAVIGVEVRTAEEGPDKVNRAFLSKMARLVLSSNILYQILINLTKSSFFIQYLRLFQPTWVHRSCKVSLVVILGVMCWGVFGGIFLCKPVRRYWDPSVPGTCMDIQTYWFSTAGIGVIMDFVVWLIPMPLIKGLNLPMRQKLSVFAVFALGGFVCVVSILRLSLVHYYAERDAMKQSGVAAIVWSTVEGNVGIICASLMVMKPLVAKIFPSILDTSHSSSRTMRLPTIHDNLTWTSTANTETTCVASRPTSMVKPPMGMNDILQVVTMDSVVEEKKNNEYGPRRESDASEALDFGHYQNFPERVVTRDGRRVSAWKAL
ncbi:uncharacterized protein J3D65DRAFT_611961 [Phyllosticta citribraziliensis]|uniref:Rhodopsin domain-containing protein n=1 Tax=Phyllosticta citribraziliensis TaxID=989973 RepID=A0ABR1MD33_9PEZI